MDTFSSGVINIFLKYFATNVIGSDTYKYYRIQDKSLIWPLQSNAIFLKLSTITCIYMWMKIVLKKVYVIE